jgi:hypothetical protein
MSEVMKKLNQEMGGGQDQEGKEKVKMDSVVYFKDMLDNYTNDGKKKEGQVIFTDFVDKDGEKVIANVYYYNYFVPMICCDIIKSKLVKRRFLKDKIKNVTVQSNSWSIDFKKGFDCERLRGYVKITLKSYNHELLSIENQNKMKEIFKNGCQ